MLNRSGLCAELTSRWEADSNVVIVLRGPAGIGKSHTAHEIADRLQAAGHRVARSHGGPASYSLPFSALLPLLPRGHAPLGSELELMQVLRNTIAPEGGTGTLLIDDIGSIDQKSAALVEVLAQSGEISVLATERTTIDGTATDHALTATMESRFDVVTLSPMTASEMTELIVDWEGEGESESMRSLIELSGGNPLVMRELFSASADAQQVEREGGRWSIASVREATASLERLVDLHLGRTTERERDLLLAIAIAGALPRSLARRFDADALGGLERRKLVEDEPIRVVHPLYRESLIASSDTERQSELFAKISTIAVDDDGVGPEQLGRWLLVAGEPVPPRIARSGAAVAFGFWDNAHAIALLGQLEEPTTDDLVMLASAHARSGDTADALLAADRAAQAAVTDKERVDAELIRSQLWFFQVDRQHDAVIAIMTLRAEVTDPDQAIRLDALIARHAQMVGDVESIRRATQLAREDESLRVDQRIPLLVTAAFTEATVGHFADSIELARVGRELSRDLIGFDQRQLAFTGIVTAVYGGDVEDATPLILAGRNHFEDVKHGSAASAWLAAAADVSRFSLQLLSADQHLLDAIGAVEEFDDLGMRAIAAATRTAFLAETGRPDEAAALMAQLTPGDVRADSRSGAAMVRLADPSAADEVGARLAMESAHRCVDIWAALIAYEAVRVGPAPRSTTVLTELCAPMDGALFPNLLRHAVAVVDGDADSVGAAANALTAHGYLLFALDALADQIGLLQKLNLTSLAGQRHAVAMHLAGRCDQPAWLPVMQRLNLVGAALDGLTQRQLDIAQRAASGASSKDLAAELGVSVRTVDNHLSAIYRKLDVSGRDELARIMVSPNSRS